MKPSLWMIDPILTSPEFSFFWNGIISCVPLWDTVGDPYDIIRGEYPEVQGAYTWKTGVYGPSLYTNAGSSGTRIYYSTSDWLPNTAATVLVISGPGTSNSFRRSFSNNANISAQYFQAIVADGGSVDYDFRFGGTANPVITVGNINFSEGDRHIFTVGPSSSKIYHNGVLVAQDVGGTRGSDTSGFSWGGWRTTDSQAVNRHYELFAMWNRQMTDDEVRKLAAFPFEALRKSTRSFGWVERRPTIRVRARGRG